MEPRLFDLDLQLLADAGLMMISIFVLFLFASYFLFNPAREFLKKRQDKIRGELEGAAKDKEDAAALKNIDKEADEILSDARKRALANENKIVADAKEEAARIIERARVEAELEKQKAADDVKREMVVIASMMAGKVVRASIDTSIQESLVNETLKEIGESTWLS